MRRFSLGLAVAIVFGGAACGGGNKVLSTCSTNVHLNVDSNGDLEIADPDKLSCTPDQRLAITFWNHDNQQPHVFLISGIGCKDDKQKGNNPTGGMLGHPTTVLPGMSKPLDGSPKMLTNDQIKAVKCNSGNPYLYSYTIKVPGAKDRDPDLEVSPPPPLQ
jgi:hypothetical protein